MLIEQPLAEVYTRPEMRELAARYFAAEDVDRDREGSSDAAALMMSEARVSPAGPRRFTVCAQPGPRRLSLSARA